MKQETFKLRLVILLALLCSGSYNKIQAQSAVEPGSLGYFQDAGRFNVWQPVGSARALGVGGSTVGLGPDAGSFMMNPAMLGMFRKSEFMFSSAISAAGTQSAYQGGSTSDNRNGFNIPNISAIFARGGKNWDQSYFKGGALGISVTRTNSFQNRYAWSGNSRAYTPTSPNSLRDQYYQLAQATGIDTSIIDMDFADMNSQQRLVYQGYAAYLLDRRFPGQGTGFTSYIPGGNYRQSGEVVTSGNQYQIDLGYGFNLDDRLFLGGSFGIATLNYREERIYNEQMVSVNATRPGDDTYVGTKGKLTEISTLSGTGVNLKLGALFAPADFVRIGVSYISRTRYSIDQNFSSALEMRYPSSRYNGREQYTLDQPQGDNFDLAEYTYRFRTPMRLNAGVTVLVGKQGFVTGEITRIDYGSSRLFASGDALKADDQTIANVYKDGFVYSVGAEWRIGDFRLRGGYRMVDNPMRGGVSISQTPNKGMQSISGGLGYRNPDFYLDFAVVNNTWTSGFRPQAFASEVKSENRMTQFVVSYGVYF